MRLHPFLLKGLGEGREVRYVVEVKFHGDFIEVVGGRIIVGLKSKPVGGGRIGSW